MAIKDTHNLVEPQGLNAGKPDPVDVPGEDRGETPAASPGRTEQEADATAAGAADPSGDVESGGDLSKAPDRKQGMAGYPDQKNDEDLTGGPISGEPAPDTKDGSSGQDSGLMD